MAHEFDFSADALKRDSAEDEKREYVRD